MGNAKTIKPYLIQRAYFKKNIREFKARNIYDLLILDYMGSFEFEGEAKLKSLNEILKHLADYDFFPVNDIVDKDGNPMLVFCEESHALEVVEATRKLARDEYDDLKEYCDLKRYLTYGRNHDLRNNFWWDIENHFFILFENKTLILTALQRSLKEQLTQLEDEDERAQQKRTMRGKRYKVLETKKNGNKLHRNLKKFTKTHHPKKVTPYNI